jgi:hypothetical protein
MSESWPTKDDCKELLAEIQSAKTTCCRCKFFEHFEGALVSYLGASKNTKLDGQCFRYPPKVREENKNDRPIVGKLDWCGEFIEREEPLTLEDIYVGD